MATMLFQERSRAESFGALAELYDRARPSYPPALVDALLADGPRRVLDIGCGTGIAGALLTARGCTVLGVEVDPRMATLARARGLEVEVAPFERWPPRGRRFDLVISAQAWHWIEPRAGVAKAAAALTPGGSIGLFWNLGQPPPPLADDLAAIYSLLEPGLKNRPAAPGNCPGTPGEHSGAPGDRPETLGSHPGTHGNHPARAEAALADLTVSGRFVDLRVRSFPWERAYTTAEWLALLRTHSDHQALPPARRERLLDAVGEAIDAAGGSFAMGFATVLVSGRRG